MSTKDKISIFVAAASTAAMMLAGHANATTVPPATETFYASSNGIIIINQTKTFTGANDSHHYLNSIYGKTYTETYNQNAYMAGFNISRAYVNVANADA